MASILSDLTPRLRFLHSVGLLLTLEIPRHRGVNLAILYDLCYDHIHKNIVAGMGFMKCSSHLLETR